MLVFTADYHEFIHLGIKHKKELSKLFVKRVEIVEAEYMQGDVKREI